MTITKVDDVFLIECDLKGCSEHEELDCEEGFKEAAQEAKDKGWKKEKVLGEWFDICPACSEDKSELTDEEVMSV